MANKGQFKKGDKRAGRKAGSKNVRTSQWDNLVASLEGAQAENFNRFMEAMWGGAKADQTTAANLYLKLLEFHKPKLQRTAVTGANDDELVIKFVQGAKPDP